jgi:heptosyltransferase-2
MRLWRIGRPKRITSVPRRILVIQLDHLGDAVLSSPLFPRLRRSFPDSRIDVLASLSNHAVFEADPRVDRVFIAERNWFERRPGDWALGSAVWQLGRRLRNEYYDLGIDVRGDILTVLVMTLAGIPRRAGWAMGGGGFLLTDVAEWIPNRHEVRSRLALIEAVTGPSDEPARASVHVDDVERVRVAGMLQDSWREKPRKLKVPTGIEGRSSGRRFSATFEDQPDSGEHDGWESPLLAVHLGAGTAAKRWPLRFWKTLIDRFLDDGWRIVVVGGVDDIDAAASLAPHENLRDWTGKLGVTATTALLERADLFLGVDSGPAHLAACAGVTSVVLFSGTNRASQWRPWSRRSLVLSHDVPCRPCHHKTCPLVDHPCMTGLTPDRVYRAALRWSRRVNRGEPVHVPFR